MNPKDKALEIYNNNLEWVTDAHIYKKRNIISISAIKCSLLTVEEIIVSVTNLNVKILHTEFGEKLNQINGEIQTNYKNFIIYWNKVKEEINNIYKYSHEQNSKSNQRHRN